MRLVWGTVVKVTGERPGLQRLAVRLDGSSDLETAIGYPALSGECAAGERVLLNTTAVDLGLGTGGAHFVVARDGEGAVLDDPAPGHIMKLRYTPLQRDVLAAEESVSPHAAALAAAHSVHGMPVVCCGLHSQLLPVAAAIKSVRPEARIAYVMTDEASLPLPLSDLVADMCGAGLLDETITAGQAFGGGLECVTLHSALLAAWHVADADVAIVAIGPGVTGTSTTFGHGGVAQGEAVNAVAALDGQAVAVLRLSHADARERHHGLSHHSAVALGSVALARALIAVPVLPVEQAASVAEALRASGLTERHDCIEVSVGALPDSRGIPYRSMGRTAEDDPAFFLAGAAAGLVAAERLRPR